MRCNRGMLKEKRKEVGDKAGKLKGGLQKLQERGELVAEAKTSCEQLLVAIVQDKRVADEQEKQV